MDIFRFESAAIELKKNLQQTASPRERALLISEFFGSILSVNDALITEAYSCEFIDMFLSVLKNYSPLYIHPDKTKSLIEIIFRLKEFVSEDKLKLSLNLAGEEIGSKLTGLMSILNGNSTEESTEGTSCFPVIEVTQKLKLGLLEFVTIQIKKRTGETVFHIIPSEREIEELISEQVKASWIAARKLAGRYYKNISGGFDVYITFNKRTGYYKGNSLGTALTLDFMNALLSYHNAPVSITTKASVALSGGLSESGDLKLISENVMKQKIKAVFFSGINQFVIPDEDLSAATEELEKLKKEFPEKNLKIVAAEKIDEILNRRDLVEIKRQSPFLRSVKFIRKNMVTVLLLLVLVTMVYFSGWWDMDDNPAGYKRNGNIITIVNKNGKKLFDKWIDLSTVFNPDESIRDYLVILDTDDDGKNEVILSKENVPYGKSSIFFSLGCYNSAGNERWRFRFTDTVVTNDGVYTPPYLFRILDYYIEDFEPVLIVSACNLNYPSAVIKIKARDGSVTGDTLWHPGHLVDG